MGAAAGITSDMQETYDRPLDSNVAIDTAEYSRIMRQIASSDDESAPSVAAFNSSI